MICQTVNENIFSQLGEENSTNLEDISSIAFGCQDTSTSWHSLNKYYPSTVLERNSPKKLYGEYEGLALKQIFRRKSAKIPVFCYS